MSFHSPEVLGQKVLPYLHHLLVTISKQFKKEFHHPILACTKSNQADEISDCIRIISFVGEIIGESMLWFGLDPPSKDSKHFQIRSFNILALSQSQMPPASSASPELIELTSIAFIGKNELKRSVQNSGSQGKSIKMPLGQCAISVEIISAIKRLRIAMAHVIDLMRSFKLTFT